MARKPNRPLKIAGEVVPPGEVRRLEIPVARLPVGSWMSLPVAVVNGRYEGPRIWLDAAIHGDEMNGVEIIRRVLRALRPGETAGAIIAVPIVNVFGLIAHSRYLPDRRDLNRSFPGSKRGSLAARLASLFLTEVVDHCEAGVDFHTGSGHRTNLSQIRCDLDDPKTKRYATHFGASVVVHSALRSGSLRAAAAARGKTILVFEGGEALRFDPSVLRAGVQGTLRLLSRLGMIPKRYPAGRVELFSRKTRWSRAARSGLCQARVKLGERVRAGDKVAVVTDTFGEVSSDVEARVSGIVIGLSTKPFVNRGDAIVHVASRP